MQQAKLLATDGAAYDYFGWSVALSGDYALVGANGDDDNGASSGSAYVFVRSGRKWSQQAKMLMNDGATDDRFGSSVSVSGGMALVGAHLHDDRGFDKGGAYVVQLLRALTDETVYDAVDAWLMDESSPERMAVVATYGQIGDWDVSQVTSLAQLFCADVDYCWQHSNAAAATFNDDISSWNISSVTSLSSAFMGASAFDVPIGA